MERRIPDLRLPALSPMQRTLARGAAGALVVFVATVALDAIWPRYVIRLPPLAVRVTADQRLIAATPQQLARAFDAAGYDLAAVRAGRAKVPYLLLREWPAGFAEMKDRERRKALFIRALQPLVLHVNRIIRAQRAALEALLRRRRAGPALSYRERAWLRRLAAFYRTQPEDEQTLLRRVAPVPPSLAIAQAAAETGWGASRFLRDGNALFGQWTPDLARGLKPLEADPGMRHAVKTYQRLVGSVWDYARNLNTHRAYRALRAARAMGITGGARLAGALERYSAQGAAYVTLIRRIIRQNGLAALDRARLAAPGA